MLCDKRIPSRLGFGDNLDKLIRCDPGHRIGQRSVRSIALEIILPIVVKNIRAIMETAGIQSSR